MVLQHVSLYDEDGKLRCHFHNVEPVLRTSHTIGNQNRQFYACPLRQPQGPNNCRFFHWKDELPPSTPPANTTFQPLATPTSPPKPHPSAPTSPTKRISPFKSDNETRQKRRKAIQTTLPTFGIYNNALNIDAGGPLDKPPSITNPPPETPQSARAIRLSQSIRDALRTPESPTIPSSSTVYAKGSDERPLTPTPTPISNGTNPSTTYRLSDLGLDLSGHRPTVSRNRSPSTGPHLQHDHYEEEEASKSEEELWKAFTPPSSAEQIATTLLAGEGKGKARQVTPDSEHQADEVNWWKDVPPTCLFTSSSHGPLEPISISTSSTSSELSGDKVESLINSAVNGLSNIPAYVYKLERRLAAMEKSNAFKAKRIRELEDEVQEFKSPRRGASK